MSLGLAAALLTVGALADAFGRRRVLVVSTGLLALTSALGAVAPSMGVLIAARILQGAAGAGVLAASLGAIGHAFHTGHRRTFAASVWGSSVGAGIAIGPLAAGAIAAWLGWRSSFWLAAAAAATLVVAAAGIEESRASTRRSTRSLGRGRPRPRDDRPDRRADRRPPELVLGAGDRSARGRLGVAGRIRRDRDAQTRADRRTRAVQEPTVPRVALRRAIHRPGRDRPDELHPAAPPARPRRQRDR